VIKITLFLDNFLDIDLDFFDERLSVKKIMMFVIFLENLLIPRIGLVIFHVLY
jgi:hypothetical protein